MFKYGSFRLFLLKFILGLIFSIVSLIIIFSLLTYSDSDPGFNKLVGNETNFIVKNIFGIYGAYTSSLLLVFIGEISYLLGLFLLYEGIKILLGINNKYIILKLFSNILGISLINFVFIYLKTKIISVGLFSIFIFDILNNLYKKLSISPSFIFLINLALIIFGIYLVIISFKVKLTYLRKLSLLIIIFKKLSFLKYFNIFKFIYRIFFKRKKVFKRKNKSEPTIKRGSLFNIEKNINNGGLKKDTEKTDEFEFVLPNKNLLESTNHKKKTNSELEKINNLSAIKLEKTLSEYGIDGKIINYKYGPIVTLFEFVPSAGIKSSKIISLSDDIARAMSSISARISSQPGKSSLGIEIPNITREAVYFGDLVNDESFNEKNNSIKLALGKDISGDKIFTDLEKMPHLLIAGTTGSGKSVGINTMILSILFRFKPNECKLILIDPKMLELSIYEDIPHLLTPVVTDPKKAVFALKWVVREMENRYKLMSSINVKNINSYNEKVYKVFSSGRKLFREVQTGVDPDTKMPIKEKSEIPLEKLPYIVVVIDEMADLMMVAGKEVESLVQRLAQMARASGIHLITATQRPSVDVITGTIKANFPSRISYKVASKFDSRTILNEMGAEQLLGSGDMLFLENGANIKRLHGGYVSETEVEAVVKHIKNQSSFDKKNEISLQEANSIDDYGSSLISDNADELYGKAVDIIVKQQKVSTSFVQRYLQIGYNRAARIIEKMEEDGIITEANNAGKRDVLKKN